MNRISEVFAGILSMGGAAAIVIAAVLLIRMLIKRFPRKYAYLLWLIVGIRLVCPVAVTSSLSLFNLRILPEKSNFAAFGQKEEEAVPAETISLGAGLPEETAAEQGRVREEIREDKKAAEDISLHGQAPSAPDPSDPNSGSPTVFPEILQPAALVWLTGIVLILLWNILAMLQVRRRLRNAVLYRENIYQCSGAASPFVAGIFRPRIYIPFHLGETEENYILQHERYHIRRGDHLIKIAAFLILTVYWFHPLVWVSFFCMVRDMEMSCDEYVLVSMGQDIREEYSRSLLAFATNRRRPSMSLPAFGESDTGKRIRHILNFHKKGKWRGMFAAFIVLAAAVVCLTNRMTEGGEREQSLAASPTEEHGYEITGTLGAAQKGETLESVEEQVRIGFWRPEDGEAEPHYYEPGGGEAERLKQLASELDPDHGCTEAMEKKLQKTKTTGYVLSYKGNVWTVYTGGYVAFLYGEEEEDDPEEAAVMYLPELYQELERICREELDYERIQPSQIENVISAEISYKYIRNKSDEKTYRQTLTEKSKLKTLENILSNAEEIRGSSACPFGAAVLKLQLKNGREIQLTWGDDSCRVIRINGIYYEYEDRYLSFSPHGIRALFDKIPWRDMEK